MSNATMPGAVFEKVRVATNKRLRVGTYMQSTLTLEAHADILANEMVFSLEAYVLGTREQKDYEPIYFRTPANWWQHLKYDVLYHWRKPRAARRWWSRPFQAALDWVYMHRPVVYEVETRMVEITGRLIYPDADVPPSPMGRPVEVFDVRDSPVERHRTSG